MRANTLLLFVPFLFEAASSENTSPFLSPQPKNAILLAHSPKFAHLAIRQNNCPNGFNSCAILGEAEACCQPNAVCSRDASNHIACCPSGAVCTGTLTGTATSTRPSQTGAQPTPNPTDPSSSSEFMFPQPGTTAPPKATGTTIPNAPYPFTYIPTTFRDQFECVQSYSACQAQSSSCMASLGGMNGVTINGGNGGGMTVPGATITGDGGAICSTLYRQACYGLQEGYCTAFGQGGGVPGGSPAIRHSTLYEIIVGMSIAIIGMIA
ncbi:hypothetical protein FQN57_005150 [Myotisia sp. PD_48]|nr:hypothetical protein FQN57_005150 [Myotisia sp. PD_48]